MMTLYRECSNLKNEIQNEMELLREMNVCLRVLSFHSCVPACRRDGLLIRYWYQSQCAIVLYLKGGPDFKSHNHTSFHLPALNTFVSIHVS
jgi:hypothetical protein